METFSDGKFTFDVCKLIEISKDFEIEEISIDDISFQLEDECWGISPKEVFSLHFGAYETNHIKRIFDADLSYPILLTPDQYVCDGMHRLAKAKYILHEIHIPVKLFIDWSEMLPAKI